MVKYRISNKAIEDLSGIWEYTYDKWSEKQADKYYRMLIETFQEVADSPLIGKKYSIIRNDLLGCRSGRHIVFYRRIENDEVEIIRILHEQMDIKNRLKKE
ncbi:MAG: type II toxin-antitoxin system RelE/ParE family toxin [Mangrovibacterium sp.]